MGHTCEWTAIESNAGILIAAEVHSEGMSSPGSLTASSLAAQPDTRQ